MNRHDRYQALKAVHKRLGWYLLGDDVSERAMARADGIATAWDRIGRLAYPMDGDYSPNPSAASKSSSSSSIGR
jgi:hypothetical protein